MVGYINNVLHKFGIQINRYPNGVLKRRIQLITEYAINKIFDVGANEGQYAQKMRKLGFTGDIISFEPLSSAFAKLKENGKKDKNWYVNNYALGNDNTAGSINVAGNSYSSSLLEMLESHKSAAPESQYIDKEEIIIKKLDSIFDEFYCANDKVMLKIDTQGFEKNVIDGAEESLKKIILIQLETSVIPLYGKEVLLPEMIKFIEKHGFTLIAIEPEFENPNTHHLLQADCIFVNNENIKQY